ncbi:hypothetical protein [Planomonospora sp. ID82291]|uniref:hypothetical protein n=1 Tax=Planomonospora sp. ID82291 TaxID=2738136 RepID=UPI0018C3F1DF|nr:hypothetical protein [Planomonospora sp. ID82291]MBG0818775.1 hypothetical protein [Planomonospora sp. ID82291]
MTESGWDSWEIKALGRAKFDSDLHPRDRKGRFIETGATVRVWGGGLGKVVKNVGGGRIEVKFPDGTIQRVHRNYLTVEKRPDGSAPTGKTADKPAELTVKNPTRGGTDFRPEVRDGRTLVRSIRGRRTVLMYGRDPRTGDAVVRIGTISQVGRIIDGQIRVELNVPGGRTSLVVDEDAVARLIPEKPLQDLIAAVRRRDPNAQRLGQQLYASAIRDDDNEAGQGGGQDDAAAPAARKPADANTRAAQATDTSSGTAGSDQPAESSSATDAIPAEATSAAPEPAPAAPEPGPATDSAVDATDLRVGDRVAFDVSVTSANAERFTSASGAMPPIGSTVTVHGAVVADPEQDLYGGHTLRLGENARWEAPGGAIGPITGSREFVLDDGQDVHRTSRGASGRSAPAAPAPQTRQDGLFLEPDRAGSVELFDPYAADFQAADAAPAAAAPARDEPAADDEAVAPAQESPPVSGPAAVRETLTPADGVFIPLREEQINGAADRLVAALAGSDPREAERAHQWLKDSTYSGIDANTGYASDQDAAYAERARIDAAASAAMRDWRAEHIGTYDTDHLVELSGLARRTGDAATAGQIRDELARRGLTEDGDPLGPPPREWTKPPQTQPKDMTPEQWQQELRERYNAPEAADAVRDALAILDVTPPDDDDAFEDHVDQVSAAWGRAQDTIEALSSDYADEPGWRDSYGRRATSPNRDWLNGLLGQVRDRIRGQAWETPNRDVRERRARLRAMSVEDLRTELQRIDTGPSIPAVRNEQRYAVTSELERRAMARSADARRLADGGDYDAALAAIDAGQRISADFRDWDRIRDHVHRLRADAIQVAPEAPDEPDPAARQRLLELSDALSDLDIPASIDASDRVRLKQAADAAAEGVQSSDGAFLAAQLPTLRDELDRIWDVYKDTPHADAANGILQHVSNLADEAENLHRRTYPGTYPWVPVSSRDLKPGDRVFWSDASGTVTTGTLPDDYRPGSSSAQLVDMTQGRGQGADRAVDNTWTAQQIPAEVNRYTPQAAAESVADAHASRAQQTERAAAERANADRVRALTPLRDMSAHDMADEIAGFDSDAGHAAGVLADLLDDGPAEAITVAWDEVYAALNRAIDGLDDVADPGGHQRRRLRDMHNTLNSEQRRISLDRRNAANRRSGPPATPAATPGVHDGWNDSFRWVGSDGQSSTVSFLTREQADAAFARYEQHLADPPRTEQADTADITIGDHLYRPTDDIYDATVIGIDDTPSGDRYARLQHSDGHASRVLLPAGQTHTRRTPLGGLRLIPGTGTGTGTGTGPGPGLGRRDGRTRPQPVRDVPILPDGLPALTPEQRTDLIAESRRQYVPDLLADAERSYNAGHYAGALNTLDQAARIAPDLAGTPDWQQRRATMVEQLNEAAAARMAAISDTDLEAQLAAARRDHERTLARAIAGGPDDGDVGATEAAVKVLQDEADRRAAARAAEPRPGGFVSAGDLQPGDRIRVVRRTSAVRTVRSGAGNYLTQDDGESWVGTVPGDYQPGQPVRLSDVVIEQSGVVLPRHLADPPEVRLDEHVERLTPTEADASLRQAEDLREAAAARQSAASALPRHPSVMTVRDLAAEYGDRNPVAGAKLSQFADALDAATAADGDRRSTAIQAAERAWIAADDALAQYIAGLNDDSDAGGWGRFRAKNAKDTLLTRLNEAGGSSRRARAATDPAPAADAPDPGAPRLPDGLTLAAIDGKPDQFNVVRPGDPMRGDKPLGQIGKERQSRSLRHRPARWWWRGKDDGTVPGGARYATAEDAAAALAAYTDLRDRPYPSETVHPSDLTAGDAIVLHHGTDKATGVSPAFPGGQRAVVEQAEHNRDNSWSVHVRLDDDRRLVYTSPVSTGDQRVERILGERPPLQVDSVSPVALTAGTWIIPDGSVTPAQVVGADYTSDGQALLRVRTADGRDDIIETDTSSVLRRAFPADGSGDVWEDLSQSRLQPAHGNQHATQTVPAWQITAGDVIDLGGDGEAALPAYVARVVRSGDATTIAEAIDWRGESHWSTYTADASARRLVQIPAGATLEQVPARQVKAGDRLVVGGDMDGTQLARVTGVHGGWAHLTHDDGRTSAEPLGDTSVWRIPAKSAPTPAKPKRTRKPKNPAAAADGPPTMRVRLRSDIRKRVLSLDIDADPDATPEAREAAAMLRASQPMTTVHMRALSVHLRTLAGGDSPLPTPRRRALERAASWIDGSFARLAGYPEPPHNPHRATPERSRAENLTSGDAIALAETNGTVTLARVIDTKPLPRFPLVTVTIEHGDGRREQRILASGVDVWLMPDLPDDVDVSPDTGPVTEHISPHRLEIGDTIRVGTDTHTITTLTATSTPWAATETWQARTSDGDVVDLAWSGFPSVVRVGRGTHSADQPWDSVLDERGGDGIIPATEVRVGDRVTFGPEHGNLSGTVEQLTPLIGGDPLSGGEQIGFVASVRTLDDDIDMVAIMDAGEQKVTRHALGTDDAEHRINRQYHQRRRTERERHLAETLSQLETSLYADVARTVLADYDDQRTRPDESGEHRWLAAPDLVEQVWKKHDADGSAAAEQVARILTDDSDDEQTSVLAKRITPLMQQLRDRAFASMVQGIVNADPLPGETRDQALRRIMHQYASTPPLTGPGIARLLAAHDLTELDDVAPPAVPDLDDEGGADLPSRMATYRKALPADLAHISHKQVERRIYRPLSLDQLEAAQQPSLDTITAYVPDIAADGGPGEHAMRHVAIIKAAGADIAADIERRASAVDGYSDAVRTRQAAQERIDAATAEITRLKAEHGATRRARLDAKAKTFGYAGIDDLVAQANADAGSQAARDRWKVITPAEFGSGELPEVVTLKARIADDRTERDAAERTIRDIQQTATLEALANLRAIGGHRLEFHDERGRRRADTHKVTAMMRDAEQLFPADWVAALAGHGPITLKATTDTPYRDAETGAIALNPNFGGGRRSRDQAVHELGHAFQHLLPGLKDAERAYLWERTSRGPIGERTRPEPTPLDGTPDQVGYPEAFPHPYSGRVYPNGHGEVFTTGVESLLAGGNYLDDDSRAWTLGVLALLGTGETGPQRDPLDGVDITSLSVQDLQDLLGSVPWGSPAYNRIMNELRGRDDHDDPLAGVNLDQLSGEALLELLGQVEDYYSVARITEALDEWEAEEAAEQQRAARIEQRVASGQSLDEAIAEEYGVSEEQMRRDRARSLAGTERGGNTEEAVRADYELFIENLRQAYEGGFTGNRNTDIYANRNEDAANRAARGRGYDSDRLWTLASWDEIVANGSPEFVQWLEAQGWMSWTEYRAQFLGRDRDVRAARRAREARGAARPDARQRGRGRSRR